VDKLISKGYDGTGKTIVILDAYSDPYLLNDLAVFDSHYGLPAPNFTVINPGGPPPAFNQGWAEEETLDVEWSHAIAPGANIILDEAQSNSDADLQAAAQYAVSNHLGDVLSQSFGENDTCLDPATRAAWHNTYAQAISEGMTVFASSGDQGASQGTCDGNSWTQVTSSPASDPLVTAVGGTELHAAGYCLTSLGCNPSSAPAPGTYQGDIAWNEGPTGDFSNLLGSTESSGGGYSTVWSEPSYQNGTGGLHGNKTGRAVPDVSYNAAIFHGVLVSLFQGTPLGGFYLFGGTSCGSPQWAAITAILDQAAGHDYGFINSALYKIGQSQSANAASFNDVTSGNNSWLEYDSNNNSVQGTGYNAGTGWDAVTGLGTPNVPGLMANLAKVWSAGQGNAAINNSKHG